MMALMFFPSVFGQAEGTVDKKTQRRLLREERKKQQEAELAQMSVLIDRMVSSRQFVLEADYLSNQYGRRIMVSPTLNFIIVDSAQGILQTASISGMGGSNMMGGVTAEGRITQYEMTKSAKSGTYTIKMMIMTSIGMYDIFLNVSPDGMASATIGGNWGGKLNYHGRLVPLGVSRVYKGRSV